MNLEQLNKEVERIMNMPLEKREEILDTINQNRNHKSIKNVHCSQNN